MAAPKTQAKEVSRYTGYDGDKARFWKWLGYRLLTPEQHEIAFEQGTERAFTGSHLDEKRPGTRTAATGCGGSRCAAPAPASTSATSSTTARPPTNLRYCINGNVLKFVPDAGTGRGTAGT